MEKEIAKLAPADAPGFRRFLDENRTKLAKMEPFLESAFLGWRDLVQMRLVKMLPMLRPHQSVDTYLKRFFTDERVRLATDRNLLSGRCAVQGELVSRRVH